MKIFDDNPFDLNVDFTGLLQGLASRMGGLSGRAGAQFRPDFGQGPSFQGPGGNAPGFNPNFGNSPSFSPSFGRGPAFGGDGTFSTMPGAQPAFPGFPQPRATQPLGTTPGTQGQGGWSGPATADDNKGLTAADVERVIAQTRPGSPMRGKGQLILDYANSRGVSVPEIMGIFLAESELGTTAGPGWNIAGVGGPGNFHGYASLDDAIRGAIDNLGSDMYRGKSLQEHIGYWFAGPQKWQAQGLDASDGANGTVREYIAQKVLPMYAAFGVPVRQDAAPARTAQPATAGRGFAAIWGNLGSPAITQEFGDTDYSRANPYNYGADFGAGSGHHGLDVGLAAGSRLYAPVGGTVIIAGGSGYYTSEGANPATSGEIRIRLDNGHELILGHTSQVNVRVGQRINVGDFLGLSGTANGPHVHVEYRVPDKGLGSGWRVVDPRTMLR